MASFATLHTKSYPRISSSNPLNSHAGRSVLIVGASRGIGFHIAKSFALSGAARVILASRNVERLASAAASLANSLPSSLHALPAIIEEIVCNVGRDDDIFALWAELRRRRIDIDVLVLCATPHECNGSVLSITDLAAALDGNILAEMKMVSMFVQHCTLMARETGASDEAAAHGSVSPPTHWPPGGRATTHSPSPSFRVAAQHYQQGSQQLLPQYQHQQRSAFRSPEPEWSGKTIINVTSFLAHMNPVPSQGIYAATKAALASLLQHLATEYDVAKLHVVNVHPGIVLTERSERKGLTESSLPWVDGELFFPLSVYIPRANSRLVELPGDFCAWAATPQAHFLHGRFVWANWDVDELIQRQGSINGDSGMLKIGLQGVEHVDIRQVFNQLASNAVEGQ